MNAKLQQLMDRSFTDHQGERFDPERFAELIIRECAKLVEDNIDTQHAWITPTYIKEHFGIDP